MSCELGIIEIVGIVVPFIVGPIVGYTIGYNRALLNANRMAAATLIAGLPDEE